MSCNQTSVSNDTTQTDSNVPSTGPISKKQLTVTTENLVGKWILDSYNIENYVHTPNMDEEQRKQLRQIIDNILGVMYFDFSSDGSYSSRTSADYNFSGNWHIGEEGSHVTVNQEYENHRESRKSKPKQNVYRIDLLSSDFLTMTDKEGLTYTFKKSI